MCKRARENTRVQTSISDLSHFSRSRFFSPVFFVKKALRFLLGVSSIIITMMSDLIRIKRAVLRGRMRLTEKALTEMRIDGLTREEVAESIMNADEIYKTIRSTSPVRPARREYLHVIRSFSLDGTLIYSKGKLSGPPDDEWFYLLISAKRDV